MIKKMVYLANPYTSKLKDPDAVALQELTRRNLESYIGGKLRKKHNVVFILPIALSAAMADICSFGTGFDEWADDDFTFISHCDEVWVLMSEGWSESKGVLAEIAFAKERGMPIKYVCPDKLALYKNPCACDARL